MPKVRATRKSKPPLSRAWITLDHTAAIAELDKALDRIARASMAGENAHRLKEGIAQIERIRSYLERNDLRIVLPPPREPGQPRPRMPAKLRTLELVHSEARAEILSRTARERKQFASVPSMLCCIALPASEVLAPPHEWKAWAGMYGAPPAERVNKLTMQRWRKWASENEIEAPVSHSYSRISGRKKLEMTSSPTFGCPYGIYPRRLMVGIATCVKQMQQNKGADTRVVHLGDTRREAISKLLGADYNIGGTAGKRFMHQFDALINSHILWWTDTDYIREYAQYDFARLERGDLLSPEMEKHLLFRARGLTLILGEHFHRDCLRAAPIDYGIFDKLAEQGGCLPVDIYLWLTFKAWYLKQNHRVELEGISWRSLAIQFGGTYSNLRYFREEFLHAIGLVQALYPKISWRETSRHRSVVDEKLMLTLKEPSIQCAYVASGTEGAPVFRQPRLESGNLFE